MSPPQPPQLESPPRRTPPPGPIVAQYSKERERRRRLKSAALPPKVVPVMAPSLPHPHRKRNALKHTFSAVKHGVIAAGHWTRKVASQQIAAKSGTQSELGAAYSRAAKGAGPLARNEWQMAKTHLRAARELWAAVSSYDAEAVANKLAALRHEQGTKRINKQVLLAALPHFRSVRIDPGLAAESMAAPLQTLTGAATSAPAGTASAALLHVMKSMGYATKAGLHFVGAKVHADAPLLAHAHQAAHTAQRQLASASFKEAKSQAAHVMVRTKGGQTAPTAPAAALAAKLETLAPLPPLLEARPLDAVVEPQQVEPTLP